MLDALRAEVATLQGPGDDERTILALHACGVPAASLGGDNLLAELLRFRRSDGSFAGQVNLTAFAIFALRAARALRPRSRGPCCGSLDRAPAERRWRL